MLLNIKVLFGFILTNLFSMILLLVIYFYYLTYINFINVIFWYLLLHFSQIVLFICLFKVNYSVSLSVLCIWPRKNPDCTDSESTCYNIPYVALIWIETLRMSVSVCLGAWFSRVLRSLFFVLFVSKTACTNQQSETLLQV